MRRAMKWLTGRRRCELAVRWHAVARHFVCCALRSGIPLGLGDPEERRRLTLELMERGERHTRAIARIRKLRTR